MKKFKMIFSYPNWKETELELEPASWPCWSRVKYWSGSTTLENWILDIGAHRPPGSHINTQKSANEGLFFSWRGSISNEIFLAWHWRKTATGSLDFYIFVWVLYSVQSTSTVTELLRKSVNKLYSICYDILYNELI